MIAVRGNSERWIGRSGELGNFLKTQIARAGSLMIDASIVFDARKKPHLKVSDMSDHLNRRRVMTDLICRIPTKPNVPRILVHTAWLRLFHL